jgi:xanthine/CO dehydrogenase XdhC/CoxF family maturation factor
MKEDKEQNQYIDVLGKIENLSFSDSAIIDNEIVLTAIDKNRVLEKKIFPSSELTQIKNTRLTDYIYGLMDSGQITGFIHSINEEGIEDSGAYIVEIIKPSRSLIVLGAGHVGKCVAIFASILGLDTTLIDDRKEFLNDQNAGRNTYTNLLCQFSEYSEHVAITPNSAIVIVTRGHQFDEICLRVAIDSKARYIGMIGSKRRVLAIVNNLKQSDLSSEQRNKLEGLYAPIGLPIGAKTPQEIAISILAQIIQVMNYSTDRR